MNFVDENIMSQCQKMGCTLLYTICSYCHETTVIQKSEKEPWALQKEMKIL